VRRSFCRPRGCRSTCAVTGGGNATLFTRSLGQRARLRAVGVLQRRVRRRRRDDVALTSPLLRPVSRAWQWLRVRLRLYLSTVWWLLQDVARAEPKLCGVLLTVSVAAVLARVGSFAALFAFVQARFSGESPTLGSWDLPGAQAPRELVGWGALVLGLTALMAFSTFAANKSRLLIGRKYAAHSVDKVVDGLNEAMRSTSYASRLVRDPLQLRRLVGGDALLLLRAVQPIAGVLLPTLQMIAAATIMVVLNVRLTLLLGLIAAAYILPYYWLNRRVIRTSIDVEDGAAQFQAMNRLFAVNITRPQYVRSGLVERYVKGPEFGGRLKALQELLLGQHRVQLLNDIFLGIAMVVLVLYIARESDLTPNLLAQLLAYLIATRYAYAGISTVTRMLATFNRFLPQVQRYVEFCKLQADAAQVDEREAPQFSYLVLTPDEQSAWTAQKSRTLCRGDLLVCVYPQLLTGPDVPLWWRALQGDEASLDHVYVAQSKEQLPPLTVRELAGDLRDSVAAARASGWNRALAACVGENGLGWHSTYNAVSAQVSPLLGVVLALSPGVRSGQPVLVVPRADWDELDLEAQDKMRGLLRDRVLVLLDHVGKRNLPTGCDNVVLLDPHGVAAVGDASWWQMHRVEAAAWVAARKNVREPTWASPVPELDQEIFE
jgi:hypothetical protein